MPRDADATERGFRPATMVLLLQALQAFERQLLAALRDRGHPDLRLKHGAVLTNVDADGTRSSVLAARAGMTRPAMGELVDDLETMGYAQREPDPRDRRAKLVVLTRRGRAATKAVADVVSGVESHYRRLLGSAQYARLHSTLAQLVGHAEPPDGGAKPKMPKG